MSVQPVTSTENLFASAQTAEKSQKAKSRTAFAGALAEASAEATKSKKAARTKLVHHDNGDYRAPRNERTKDVDGHAYSDILSGPRNGMYVNTSGNKRHGEAFSLVIRDGKRYHIYGEGKDRLVVCLKPKKDVDTDDVQAGKQKAAEPAAGTAPSGTSGSA
jgi:hypothetical protein